ncbi:hypothetical protein [Bacillus mycoides]|nr:hypothetical protein [Bacillus mycoides]
MRFKQVEDGVWFDKTWHYNVARYTFTTDEKCKDEKLKELGMVDR